MFDQFSPRKNDDSLSARFQLARCWYSARPGLGLGKVGGNKMEFKDLGDQIDDDVDDGDYCFSCLEIASCDDINLQN